MPDTAVDAIRSYGSRMPDTAVDAIRSYESKMPDTAADAIRPYANFTGGQIWVPFHPKPPGGRGGEAKLRKKFFAKLSFKKAA